VTTQSTTPASTTPASASAAPSRRWRVIDIVIASVLGVALGLVFILWNLTSGPWREGLGAVVPGLGALLTGVWLLPGVLGGLIVRKPGAALFTEVVAATVSVIIVPNEWGWWTIEAGLVQGLGAELVFALLLYKRWGVGAAVLAGVGAGVAMAVNDLIVWYAAGLTPEFAIIYLVSAVITGAVIAGLLSWLLVRALAATGVLGRFAAGRERRELV
jgi:energy-coupling factor transport system substrate-specific component